MNSKPQKKTYTSREQREILESVDIPHVKGRSSEEADRLIQEQINAGKLPADTLTRPTQKQISYAKELGITIPVDATRDDVQELFEHRKRQDPLTENQSRYIKKLGGIVYRGMSKYDASCFIEFLMEAKESPKLLEDCEVIEFDESYCRECGRDVITDSIICPRCGGVIDSEDFYPLQRIEPPPHIYTPPPPKAEQFGSFFGRLLRRVFG